MKYISIFFTAYSLVFGGNAIATEYAVLIRDLEQVIKAHDVASYAVVLVSANDTLFQHAAGVSDRVRQIPASVDTLYRIGSITKAFTSLAILKLQEQGDLQLDDLLRERLADAPWNNPWQRTNPVRLVHFLEQNSGLLDMNKAEFDHNDPAPISLRQGLNLNGPRQPAWPPGLFFSYSNIGAGFPALVLEKITGMTYEKYVKQNIFKALQMPNASLLLDDVTRQKLATGYDHDGYKRIPYWHMLIRPFGAINATPREMGNFVKMLLNDGRLNGKRIFSKTSIRRMELPQTTLAARAGLKYGYGLGNYQYVSHGLLFHGHGGDGDGYLAHYAYNRDIGKGYFVVINAFNNRALKKMRAYIEATLVGRHKAVQLAQKPLTEDFSKKWAGKYQAVTYRFPWLHGRARVSNIIQVQRSGSSVQITTVQKNQSNIYHVGDLQFRGGDEPVATSIFLEYDGHTYYISDLGNYIKISD